MIYFFDLGLTWIAEFFGGSRPVRIFFAVASFLAVWLTIGLRWKTGSDWDYYYANYSGLSVPGFEPGYLFLVKVFSAMGLSYTTFLLFISFVPLILIVFFLYKKSDFYFASLSFFVVNYMLSFMGGNRQSIAIGILCVSVLYIEKRALTKFLICVGIATLFHYSALAFLPAYYIARMRLTPIVRYSSILIAVVIAVTVGAMSVDLPISIFRSLGFSAIVSKLIIYKEYLHFDGFSWGSVVKKVGLLVIFDLALRRIRDEAPESTIFLNLYFVSIIIDVIFGSINAAFVRAGTSYRILEIVLVAYVLRAFNAPRYRYLVYCLFLAYAVRQLYAGLQFYYDLYIPYRSVLG
ncbi:MAG TPA: EpsG family protein, partial [Spirochaetota bacterium]